MASKETLRIHPAWRGALETAGFRRLGDFLAKGEVIRHRDGKENVRVRLGEGEAAVRLFLKRHPPGGGDPGWGEMENHQRVSSLGIDVPEVAATGKGPGGSFLATVEIAGGLPADRFLEEELGFPPDREAFARKRRLLGETARIARTLHERGLCHRDLYLCHFFVVPGEGDRIVLIDLQRVRPLGAFRRRWIVKDLAALNHSAKEGIVSVSDRLRFLRTYLGLDRLDGRSRKLVRRIAKKTARIRRHAEKRRR